MKKKYVKPYLGMESFQLNAAVAAVCSDDDRVPINHRAETCSFPEGRDQYGQFFSLVNCQMDLTGGEDGNNTLCYHGPEISNGIVFTYS